MWALIGEPIIVNVISEMAVGPELGGSHPAIHETD